MYYVYLHINPSTNLPFYVGKGKGNRCKQTRSRSIFWRRIVEKYGFSIQIVQENLTHNEAYDLEVSLIRKYGRRDNGTGILVNLTDGGEGSVNYKHTEDSLAKMKLYVDNRDMSGEKNPNFNNKWSEEQKMNLSKKKKGKKTGAENPFYGKTHSDELKRRVSERLKGKPLCIEHRKKISDSNKGRVWYNNGSISRMFKSGEVIEGFVKGRLK